MKSFAFDLIAPAAPSARQPASWGPKLFVAAMVGALPAATVGAAHAAPIQFVTVAGANGVFTDTSGVGQRPGVFNHGPQLSQAAAVDFTGAVGTITASSASSLATASLRAASSNIISNPANTFGQRAFSFAYIGDVFTHTQAANPSLPFVWSNQTTATFRLHVDGNVIANPGLNTFFSDNVLALQIFRHASPLDGTLDDAFGGTRVFQCAGQATYWSLGRTQLNDFCGNPFKAAFMPDAQGNVVADIDFSFQPGGDFEFAFGLQIGATMGLDQTGDGAVANGVGSAINNFLNTATISYIAPSGALVTSGSGVFPGTLASPVPEPSTWSLMSLGLLGLLAVRKHGRSA